jgi:hypothetical protein
MFIMFVSFLFCLILGADFYYCIESVIQCSCLILFVPFLIVFVSWSWGLLLYRVSNLVFFFRVLIQQQIMYIRSGPNKSLNLNI